MPQTPTIREAHWPADLVAATTLLRHYADFLNANSVAICLQGYEEELRELPRLYTLPSGTLLLASLDGEPAGCVALKVRTDRPGAIEMKRLWVEPSARGHTLGQQLTEAAIAWSREHRAETLLLDTVKDTMPQAAALYRRLGFRETSRHNTNPVPGLTFFTLPLR